jgi:hypothetical protein
MAVSVPHFPCTLTAFLRASTHGGHVFGVTRAAYKCSMSSAQLAGEHDCVRVLLLWAPGRTSPLWTLPASLVGGSGTGDGGFNAGCCGAKRSCKVRLAPAGSRGRLKYLNSCGPMT